MAPNITKYWLMGSGLLVLGDQGESVAVGVCKQRPPAERLLDGRLRELHAAGAQLPVGLLQVLGVEGHVGGWQARAGRGRPRPARRSSTTATALSGVRTSSHRSRL